MSSVVHVESVEHLRRLAADTTALCVEFSAEWCVPCQRFADKYASLADYFSGNVVFATVDLAQPAFDALDEAWDVRTVPTFVVLVGGRPVRKLEGLQHKRPARLLAKALREVLETMPADEAGRGR